MQFAAVDAPAGALTRGGGRGRRTKLVASALQVDALCSTLRRRQEGFSHT